MILLPGALGALEGSDAAAERLRLTRAVTTFDYRAQDSLETVLGRIETAVGDGPADLLGQSYGGWIAQCFARRRPERVRRLVLSHSFTLTPGDAWRFRLAPFLLRALPRELVRALVVMRIRRALRPVALTRPDLYRRQLLAIDGLARSSAFLPGLAAQQDTMRQSLRPAFAKLPPVKAPVMIIESDDDPLIGAGARAALRAGYRQATVLRFERAGHFSAIVETDRYVAAVVEFLDSPMVQEPTP